MILLIKNKNMEETILYNTIIEWRKKEISPILKAKIIKEYITDKKISLNGFAKKFNLTMFVVQNLLLWDNINEDEYKKMKEIGLTNVEIYTLLKKNKNKESKDWIEKMTVNNDLKNIFNLNRSLRNILENLKSVKQINNDVGINIFQQIKNEVKRLNGRGQL